MTDIPGEDALVLATAQKQATDGAQGHTPLGLAEAVLEGLVLEQLADAVLAAAAGGGIQGAEVAPMHGVPDGFGEVFGVLAEDLVGSAEVEMALHAVGGQGEEVLQGALGASDLTLSALRGVSDVAAHDAIDLGLPRHGAGAPMEIRVDLRIEVSGFVRTRGPRPRPAHIRAK
ncbi:MAG: hypothetical protein P1V36_06670 [Planctomycetota bacterium]|nr:hypothetical protein [Planctomycetota bacterium]